MIEFAAPLWFWAFAGFPFVIALYLNSERRRRIVLDWLIAARLQPRLAGSVSVGKRRVSFVLTLLAFALAICALARPQWGFSWEERRDLGRDILIAVDTSRSMLAADLQPSRLKRAKLAAEDLLTQLKGDRVGVIAFAGSSFLQAPLTADFSAARDTIGELDSDIIPRGGTNLTEAILAANDAFGKGESEHRALIIFTDGEELEEDAVKAAREHKDKFRTFTVGLGSADGALIPLLNERGGTEFVINEKGEYVKSKLDEKRLREVAEAGGGFYVHLQNGPAEMKQIVTDGLGKMKDTSKSETQFLKKPTERYQWPLAAAVLCWMASLCIGDRKRVARSVASVVMFALLQQPTFAAAESGQSLFSKSDYAGAAKAFDEQRAKGESPELDYNLGISAYKAGDFEASAEALSRALGSGSKAIQAKAATALANTLARRSAKRDNKEEKISDWKNAVQHYERSIELDPANADAKHNLAVQKRALAMLEKKEEEKKQEEKKNDKSEDKKDGEKSEQEKQDGEKKDGEKSEQQKQDGEKKDGEKSEQQKQDGEKKDGEKSEQEKQDGEKKDGEKSEQEKQDGEKKDGEKKDGESGEEQKDGEKKDGEKGEKSGKPKPGEEGEKSDKPGEKQQQAEQQKEGEKKQGELKATNPGEKNEDQEQQAAEAAEEMAAAKEGRMTQKDAKQLLESMRRTERRVRLLDPRQEMQNKPRSEKNW